jgi:hypothetical protein
LGVILRIVVAGVAVFFGGVTLVIAALNYSLARPPGAPWTERAFSSGAIGLIGMTVTGVVLVAAYRPTPRRLLAVLAVLVAAPLLARAI